MKKQINQYSIPVIVLLAVCIVLTVTSFFGGITALIVAAVLLVAAAVFTVIWNIRVNRNIQVYLRRTAITLGDAQHNTLRHLPQPVIAVDKDGEILWYNDVCRRQIFAEKDFYCKNISEVLPGINIDKRCPEEGVETEAFNRMFTAFYSEPYSGNSPTVLIYLIDDTDKKRAIRRYEEKDPAVVMIAIDSYSEMFKNEGESGSTRVLSEINVALRQYAEKYEAMFCKLDEERFILMLEEKQFRKAVEARFEILDTVRSFTFDDKSVPSISIGVSNIGDTLRQKNTSAKQSLDMAQGRGGDQAAVKTINGYEFYGGISKGVEKRTKVKTRIIANALTDLVDLADNVVIMGHKYADMDVIGAAAGLMSAVTKRGKNCLIAMDRQANLVEPVIRSLENKKEYQGTILDPVDVLPMIKPKTLLIIVDAHSRNFIESPEIYDACQTVVVIDHHRRTVDYINNAVIFFHEVFASSASEMVTEILQYFASGIKLDKCEAEALLAGITLDTKNFVLKTGVKTFEAAAFLRSMGADTVEVKKFFSLGIEAYQERMSVIAAAVPYKNCCISECRNCENVKVVAAQAADELLNIAGIDASFVMFYENGGVSISARSMGRINVQLIMEYLGGGGHQTMAATQLSGYSMQQCKNKLYEAIDDYYEKNAASLPKGD